MGFISLNCPFFLVLMQILIFVDLRVVLEQIFICIEEILVLYIRDSNFLYCLDKG